MYIVHGLLSLASRGWILTVYIVIKEQRYYTQLQC